MKLSYRDFERKKEMKRIPAYSERNETARAVKPDEPWKRGIVGEKFTGRARPLVGVDATKERERERNRKGVGGIEVDVCLYFSPSLPLPFPRAR